MSENDSDLLLQIRQIPWKPYTSMRFFNWFLHAIVLLWYPTRLDVAQMTWDTCCRLRTRCDGPLSPLLTAALTVRVRRRRRAARRASAAVALAHGGAGKK